MLRVRQGSARNFAASTEARAMSPDEMSNTSMATDEIPVGEISAHDAPPLIVFVIHSSDEFEASLISDLLWSHGIQGIEESELPDGRILLRSSFGLAREETECILRDLLSEHSASTWRIDEVETSVIDTWKQFARPIRITPELVVTPAWCPVDERTDSETRIRIDPGNTFGLGDHPTTRGSLLLLSRLGVGKSILDVGCGSGILGITALVLGANHARGVDINPASVPVSQHNARLNGVESKWHVSLETLDSVDEGFDIVFANILAPTLIELSANLRRLTHTGTLVISGVLAGHFDHVLSALSPMHVVDRVEIEGWAAVALRI